MPQATASVAFGVQGRRSETAVTIHLANNLLVEVTANTDIGWLGELLNVLRKPEHAARIPVDLANLWVPTFRLLVLV